MLWRPATRFAKQRGRNEGAMAPESVHLIFSLAIGFAFAGLLATGYQLFTSRALSFRGLERGPYPSTFLAGPILVFAAPFLIIRHNSRGQRHARPRSPLLVRHTEVAGFWK